MKTLIAFLTGAATYHLLTTKEEDGESMISRLAEAIPGVGPKRPPKE